MSDDALVTASYTIPQSVKDRIDQVARESDLNASQVMRRILVEHFSRRQSPQAAPEPQPEPAAA